MNLDTYAVIKLSAGVIATIGLYSVLYQENKLFRFFEHMFLGLAAGYTLVATWKDTLYVNWWQKIVGQMDESSGKIAEPGYWAYIMLLPIGLMGYMVFSKKNNWMSRIPIGIILGMWAGQQILIWWNTYGPQIYSSMQPVWPTTTSSFTRPNPLNFPEADRARVAAEIGANIYASQALSNLIFVIALLASLSYFLFSFELKGKAMLGFNKLGRWTLMIGFGAIFGSTVMARFALVIDRMFFIWVEWVQAVMRVLSPGG
jgi:hypothetical protein